VRDAKSAFSSKTDRKKQFKAPNSAGYPNLIVDYSVNYRILKSTGLNMSLSFIFTFAPVPLTEELSPLAHAAALARRRQAESQVFAKPRYRIQEQPSKPSEAILS
jgi:hypothetical protein